MGRSRHVVIGELPKLCVKMRPDSLFVCGPFRCHRIPYSWRHSWRTTKCAERVAETNQLSGRGLVLVPGCAMHILGNWLINTRFLYIIFSVMWLNWNLTINFFNSRFYNYTFNRLISQKYDRSHLWLLFNNYLRLNLNSCYDGRGDVVAIATVVMATCGVRDIISATTVGDIVSQRATNWPRSTTRVLHVRSVQCPRRAVRTFVHSVHASVSSYSTPHQCYIVVRLTYVVK